MTILNVKITKLSPEGVIPAYSREGDAGLDLVATRRWFDDEGNCCYGTSLAVEIPEGYYADLRPRSSVSKYDLVLANSVGTIDSNYRGELILKFKPVPAFYSFESPDEQGFDLISLPEGDEIKVYQVGDRIAQLLIKPYPRINFIEVSELSDSNRGDQGFGSSGK